MRPAIEPRTPCSANHEIKFWTTTVPSTTIALGKRHVHDTMKHTMRQVKPFIFYKMFYGRDYCNFQQNEIKIKVIDFGFIFIFPPPVTDMLIK